LPYLKPPSVDEVVVDAHPVLGVLGWLRLPLFLFLLFRIH